MKKNITIIISIGCVALILTMLMFTQFKTVDETDIMAIETMRETELRAELANWKKKYEEIDLELQEREQRIAEYKSELNSDADSSLLLTNEVKEAETYLGYTSVQGEGIVVTLSDGNFNVEYYELLELVNELNIAGAEAISINEERIVSDSEIMLVNDTIIIVNGGVKITGPFEVKAIGNKKDLETSLSIKSGFIDRCKYTDQINVECHSEDNIIIPAYNKEMNFKYAKEYKEQEEK